MASGVRESSRKNVRYDPLATTTMSSNSLGESCSVQQETESNTPATETSKGATEHVMSSASLFGAFWAMGLLNNGPYVIMLASAKHISEGGTALVYLVNVLPGFAIKLSAPYWFHRVSYARRLQVATTCMVVAFALVASSSQSGWELLGVAFVSAQCGLGEASLLALAGKYDGRLASGPEQEPTTTNATCLTGFSSGTGLAGVFGYAWVFLFNTWLGWTLSTTLWLAQIQAVAYYASFHFYLYTQSASFLDQDSSSSQTTPLQGVGTTDEIVTSNENKILNPNIAQQEEPFCDENVHEDDQNTVHNAPNDSNNSMTPFQRLIFVIKLYPYIIPLFMVYAAEYALQSGTWTAIGFPVTDEASRDAFYEYSNWAYQAGVFISRSSGTLFTAPMWLLWLMPTLQCGNLVFFTYVATLQAQEQFVWYHSYEFLIPGCVWVGLLGGAVYVHGYKRVCADFPDIAKRELALASTSVAESMGVVAADVTGLFLESCLYQIHGILGEAVVSCPIKT